MNKEERLNLQKMIAANDVVDQTTAIRKLKHADLIWNDVKTMSLLKNKYARIKGSETWSSVICKNCNFLFNHYTDIYNRLLKDELDVNILYTFIQELKSIENGETDQHEASFKVGTLLKELYVDSALKKAESLDKHGKKKTFKKGKKVSWAEYKTMHELDDIKL